MAVPTDPDELQAASACYCYGERTTLSVIVYLLANIAGLSATPPSDLARDAACYCYDEATMQRVIAYLLCIAANGGTAATCAALSGAGDPTGVTTPEFSGQLYHDTTNDVYYRSTGTTSADWVIIDSGPCVNLEGVGEPI